MRKTMYAGGILAFLGGMITVGAVGGDELGTLMSGRFLLLAAIGITLLITGGYLCKASFDKMYDE